MHVLLSAFFRTTHGGLHDHVAAQVHALRGAGEQVTVLCPPGPFADSLRGTATPVVTDSFQDISAAVDKALEAGPFDVVHSHPFEARMVGHGVARTLEVPFVLTLHGLYLDGLNEYSDDVDVVIAVSAAIRDLVISEVAMGPGRVLVIHNGVDRELYRPDGTRQETGRPCVVVSTRLDEDKRVVVELLKETWNRCSAADAPNWSWMVAGDGTLLDEAQAAAAGLRDSGGQPAVRFLGWQEDAQLAELYRTADAVIAPGRCALEAMACGAPTVAVGSKGYVGPVDDDRVYRAIHGNFGGQGAGYSTEDGAEMYRDVLRVLTDSSYAARLRRLGTTVVDAFFNQDHRSRDLVGLYRIVHLAGRRSSRPAASAAVRAPTPLQEAHATLERERRDFRRERETLQQGRAQLRAQLRKAEEERYEARRQLVALQGTTAMRLADRLWTVLNTTLPQGSRRRRAYQSLRSRRGLPAAGGDDTPAHDVVRDLADFEAGVRASGADAVAVLLCGTKLIESEGQRPTRLALELARQGMPVVFAYWRWGPREWAPQDLLDRSILQVPVDVVVERPGLLADAFAGLRRLALFEFPYPGFFELLATLNATGWTTVYDVLDDWEEFRRVGQADWYEDAFERHLVTGVDAVFAINDVLADRVRTMGGDLVEVVGNGLEPQVAEPAVTRTLERGEITLGYFGHLTDAWFDWRLVAEVARRAPRWRVYLIGYGGEPGGVELPANVTLLGRKPHDELAAYAANWDVAVIPFKPERLAAGADPIKTYEYLAMGLPVVVTGVHPPPGGEEFVVRVEGADAFLAAARRAANRAGDVAPRMAFAATCTWERRVEAILGTVARDGQRVGQKSRLFPVQADQA